MGFLKRLTRYEITRIISARALQLSLGAPPLIKEKGSYYEIAKKEFEKKVLPIVVIRKDVAGRIEKISIR